MKRKFACFVFLVAALSISGIFNVFATEEESGIPIDKIVVTPSRAEESYSNISRKVEIIGFDDIEAAQAKDLSSVLAYSDSLDISSYGGPGAVKTLRMRGSTASQIMVLVDGRPINNPRDGQVDFSTVPLDNIDRVEVMQGPASSLYGSSAMGGVIQILTKNPPLKGSTTEVSSSFGTFRTYQERLSHGRKIGKFGYLFTGDYQSSVGIRDNSAFSAKDFSVKLTGDITDNQTISINTGFYTSLAGSPGPTIAIDPDDKRKTLKNFIAADWRLEPDPDTEISVKIYNNYDRLELLENGTGSAFDFPFVAYKKDIHKTQARGLDIQTNKRFNEHYRAVVGFNAVNNLNNSTSSAKHDYSVLAGYIDNEFTLNKRLKTNLSARLDRYSNFGFQASPNASALFTINEKNKLHGLISRSFRAPTFNDLYWPDEMFAKGNPNLTPETSTSGELGLTSDLNEHIQIDLTYFRSFCSDLIQWAPVSADPFAAWTPTNIGSAVIEGVEFKNRLSVSDDLEMTAGYTFQKAKDEKTNKFLVYQPKNKFSFSIEHRDVFGWEIGAKGQWTGLRFNNAGNSTKVKSFFILGFHASKKWKTGMTYFVNIDNALNRKYQSNLYYPEPGFDLTSGVKFEF